MIEIKNIIKNYQSGDTTVNALKNISISFRKQEFVSILGQSGCGKTTLLNILGGLDKYTSGDLIINNKSTKQFKDKDWDSYRNHHVGFVFQSYNLIMHLNVVENVELALSIAGLNKKERREKAITALKKVGLIDKLYKKPNQLSGGQMQRVSIARAIVNNPAVILADEPTGALDSETSVQVMEILKEISKDHLVVMVTHNKELALKYSTRIINLFDGQLIGDSNPIESYEKDTLNVSKANLVNNKTEIGDKNNKHKQKKEKTSMGFFTALRLSFKNLLTKKGRSFMTSFAGSIGIIGIALILAVANGFTGYINKLQSDTLSGYPIGITTISMDMDTMMNGKPNTDKKVRFPNYDHIIVNEPSTLPYAKYSHYNYISPAYVNYIKKYEELDKAKKERDKTINTISYSYASPLTVLTKDNGVVKQVKTTITTNPVTGENSSLFYEGLDSKEFIESQYDILYGSYPKEKDEVALVINPTNELNLNTLKKIGLTPTKTDDKYDNIKFSDICGKDKKEYQVVLTDNVYSPIYDNDNITEFKKNKNITSLYDNPTNVKLHISAILRVKKSTPMSIYPTGIVYLPKLTTYVKELESNSILVKEQRKQENKFFVPLTLNFGIIPETFENSTSLKNYVKTAYNVDLSTEQCNEYALQSLGASTIPSGIRIYAKNFEKKDEILKYLDEWNNTTEGKINKIQYSDATEFLTSTMGQMVNIISYVLIAFSAISLVVSSIMIGIITYVSVIERTKEIGVLRSIGARKKDISRVFNAETILIGFSAGFIGILISFVLTFPLSSLIKHLAGGTITAQLAVLHPLSAIVLILVSIILTFISGLIPSSIAAKKDPVTALKSE